MANRRKLFSWVIFSFMALYFLSGLVAFPSAPYRPCGTGYCDKLGGSHTFAEYRHQRMWEVGLIGLWSTGIFALYLINRKPAKR